MPNIQAAKKSIRADVRKRVFNDRRRRAMRQAIKEYKALVVENVKDAAEKLPEVFKAIDKAQKRGIIKQNTASRKKSQLSKMLAE
jgi:small subunit ribosomal protein S20